MHDFTINTQNEVRSTATNVCIGKISFQRSPAGDGWQFCPHTTAHGRSRKIWPTKEAAIPAWVKAWAKRETAKAREALAAK